MCDSFFQSNDSVSVFDESVFWACVCREYVGSNVFLATLGLFFIVGMPLYCWSIWMFLQKDIKPHLVFPINITIADLIFCVHCIIDMFISIYPSVSGDRMIVIFIGLSWTVKPLIQTCMCIDHYLAVIHPVTFLRYKDIKYRTAVVTVGWLIAACNSVRLFFIGIEYFPDHVFFVVFCIAVTITSFCCASVLHALKRPGPGDRNNVEMTEKDRPNKSDKGRAVENQQKRRAFKIISHILVSILVCYFPQVVAYFMHIAKISKLIYICNAFPLIWSFSMIAILILSLVKMYNEGQLIEIKHFLKSI